MSSQNRNRNRRPYDPNRRPQSETAQRAAASGYKSPQDGRDKAFDPAKHVEGWDLLLPFSEVKRQHRYRLMDVLKHVSVPVNVEVVREHHILETNFTALADLMDVIEEYFVADPIGWHTFMNGTDGATEAEIDLRVNGLCVSYAVLLGKHFSSTN